MEDIMTGYKDNIGLSPQFGAILDRLNSSPLQFSFLGSGSGDSSSGLSEENSSSASLTGSNRNIAVKHSTFCVTQPLIPESEKVISDEVKDENTEPGVKNMSSPISPLSLLSPKAMKTERCIMKFEQEQRQKAQVALEQRQEMREQVVVAAANSGTEQLKRFEEYMALKQRQEYQSMRDMVDFDSFETLCIIKPACFFSSPFIYCRTKESIRRQEKLKEENRRRMKIMNLKLREAEQQRQREAELEQQVEGKKRLCNLNTLQEEILQLNQLLDPSTQTKTEVPMASLSTRGNQLCSQVSEVVRKTAEGQFPSVEDVTMAERALHDMRRLIRLMQEEVANANVAQWAKEAPKKGLQNGADESTLKWYKELQDFADQCAKSMEQLNSPSDPKTKKLKQELLKAATISVSQISLNSGSQVKDVYDKIEKLLSGQPVVFGRKAISTSQHPQGLDFVCYKLAELFAKQGEEEVTANHKAAFPIAAVASGIWEKHPRVGDLILAHMHKKCPYTIPHYPPMKKGVTMEEYQRILGYRMNSSGLEGQDVFLKRMCGMIRLYAAIIQQKWPYSSNQGPAPHGLNHGWRWLAQMLNMEPVADITATILMNFLEVCGNALMKQYQDQFWKLIVLLKEEYFPRIKAVTCSGEMGSVVRLQVFLETALRTRHISPPEGQPSSTFWKW